MKPKKSAKFFIGLALSATGLVIVGFSAFNIFVGDSIESSNQQQAAEVEPLVTTSSASSSALAVGQVFAKIRIPRFGSDYVRNIAEGTSVEKVLNTVGIGHYLNSAMPGQVGNFALAGHRAGNGGPMRLIDKFQPGDTVTVETSEASYTYRYLESKIVAPDAVGVITAVPEGLTGATPTGKYLTLTTCTPIYINTDRYVAWFELVN